MKRKRIIGLLLTLALVMSVMSFPVFEAQAAYSDNVLFEYGFDDYTGGAPSAKGTGVTMGALTNQSAANKLYAGTDADGNKYLYSDFDAYCAAYDPVKTSWANVGFQLSFDAEFAATGKYAVSFDISRGDMEASYPTDSSTFVLRTTTDGPFRIIGATVNDGAFFGYKSQTPQKTGTTAAFLKNTIHRVDVLFDLDSKYSEESEAPGVVKAFVDGQLVTAREYTYGLAGKTLQWRLEHEIPYIDNVKVAKVTADSFEIKDTAIEEDSVTLTFTETMESYLLSDNDFIVTNAVTGEEVLVDSVMYASDSITLGFQEGTLKEGSSYLVEFSDNVKSIGGTAAKDATFFLPTKTVEGTAAYEEFEEFTAEEMNLEDYADMSYNSFKLLYASSWTTSSPFKAVEAIADGEDDKVIRITRNIRNSGGESNTFSDMRFALPHNIYFEGDVTLEYRIRVSADTNAFRPYLIAAGNSQNYQLAPASSIPTIWYESGDVRYSNNTTKHNGNATLYKENEVDGTQFHTYKAVYHFDESTVDIYFDGEQLNSAPLSITNFDKRAADGHFTYIDFRHNGANETSYVDIDYIKVSQSCSAPFVTGFSFEKYDATTGNENLAGTEKINISFAGNIDSESLTEDTVTLYEGENKVKYTPSFDPKTRTYTMNVTGLLAGNSSYKVQVTDGAKDSYENSVIEIGRTLSTGAGEKLSPVITFHEGKKDAALADVQAGDTVTVKLTVIDTTRSEGTMAVAGTVVNADKLSALDVDNLVWNDCVGTATATLTVDSIENVEIKAFAFGSIDSIDPVLVPSVLN